MSNSISETSPALFDSEPPSGTRIGSYILDRKLGAGGRWNVWRVVHQATGQLCVLKFLRCGIATHPDVWDQVQAEVQLLRKLNHQHILPVHLLERDPQWGPYQVMTFIDGITLSKYRQRKKTFTVEEVAKLLRPVAEALDYAHAQNVIHRDVTPENILLTLAKDGETIAGTFVVDFSLAAQVRLTVNRFNEEDPLLATGTPSYIPREIWLGRYPGPASDQYALGVIAYGLLAGEMPFQANDVLMLREAVLNEHVIPIPTVPSTSMDVLIRCLSKSPEYRFESTSQFVTALLNSCVKHTSGQASQEAESYCDEFTNSTPSRVNNSLNSPSDCDPMFIAPANTDDALWALRAWGERYNHPELREHIGKWVAIYGFRVILSGDDMDEVTRQAVEICGVPESRITVDFWEE